MMFEIYPAIDLRNGSVVRLRQGDANRQTTYGDDPVAVARHWERAGATWLHLVNLDGAFEQDDSPNRVAISAIMSALPGVSVQVGGGLRDIDAVENLFSLGLSRAIIGTAVLTQPGFVKNLVVRFGADRIAVAIDARDGVVQMRGWTESSQTSALALASSLVKDGLHTVIYTDVSRDGMGTGVNVEICLRLAEATGLEVIASGGVRSLEDVYAAKSAGLAGVIIGRALYEGQVNLTEALQC